MSVGSYQIELARLGLESGQGKRLERRLDPGELILGGVDYTLGEGVDAIVEASRTSSGWAFRLHFEGTLRGVCMRCLDDAEVTVSVDAREVDQPSGDEELMSPYVADGVLDVTAWAHDALALSLPQTLLCRPDCAGLCDVCGASLNDADPAEHRHEEGGDPRWAKLRELG